MSRHSLFISDLHLDASRPLVTQAFISFIHDTAKQAERLFILGDLFEYWAGDDDLDEPSLQGILNALASLQAAGCALYIMHGNRDFLLAERFMQRCHAQLLADPTLVDLYTHKVLLSHGDALCTDDIGYQQFRAQVRQASWQQQFLAQPLTSRKQQIDALRQQSELAKQAKSSMMMDVNEGAVEQLFAQFDYPPLLIHGHTHRPGQHTYQWQGHACQRLVLGDWYAQASCLRMDDQGCRAIRWEFAGQTQ